MKRPAPFRFARLAAFVFLAPFGACANDRERPGPFIAFERDFQGFRRWREVPLPKLEAQGITHSPGRAREYVNAPPATGRATFPVGTMIVKEVVNEEDKRHELFAMVKRGADYNQKGALGWEWFELRERPDHSFAIVWRGVNAPDGESYTSDALGGCNACHELARKNDFVKTPALALASVSPGKLARE